MKTMKMGAMAAAALLLIAGSASAVTYTLDDLIANNTVVTIGDKQFADWGFGSSGGGPLTSAGVTVNATYVGNDYYLSFAGAFNANLGAAYDYQLYYSVATISGQPSIIGIDQAFNLTALGTGGIIGIGETVFDAPLTDPNRLMVAQSSVGFIAGVGDFTDPPGELAQGDQLIINPGQDKVYVTKDIALLSAPQGGVGVTILTQSFHQNVPDGGLTLAMLGFALSGIALIRRTVRG